jgi:hypothetical protein
MKKGYFLLLTSFCLLLSAFLWSCGGGAGSPGSGGTEDTGIIIDAALVPTYLDENTNSVDVFQQVCDAGPPPEFEEFTDHSALVTLTAHNININPPVQQGDLHIEKYTIDYRRSSDSIGAPPIQSDTRFATVVIPAPVADERVELTFTVNFLDLVRKDRYQADVLSGQFNSGLAFINNYTAVYTFEGKSENGDKFSFRVQHDFQIGSFDYCD